MGRAAERLGDSNPTPRGCEDDLLVRMTAVWLRNSTAAMLQSYVAALPFFPCFLFSRNRNNSSFFSSPGVNSSLSQKTPLNKPGSPIDRRPKRPLEAYSPSLDRSLNTGTTGARTRTQIPTPAPAPAFQVPCTPKHRTPQLTTPIPCLSVDVFPKS